jgi:hypothetical protein
VWVFRNETEEGRKKGALAVLKPKHIHQLTDEYAWAVPRGP